MTKAERQWEKLSAVSVQDIIDQSRRSLAATPPRAGAETRENLPARTWDMSFETLPAYQQLALQRAVSVPLGIENPYYRTHEMRAGATSRVRGRNVINFASYDYLGLNGDTRIISASVAAAEQWGTSVSASRLTAGERPAHSELEQEIASLYEAEDAVAFVSGHATAVSTIATLLGPEDLLVYDALIHNCIVVGGLASGASRRMFSHNDLDALEEMLSRERGNYDRALIATEGLFSMDGDGPDLARLIDIKQRFGCWLLVDDAHGLGVIGATGRGIFEHLGLPPGSVDIWLGTLSKTLVSCGGYVAGSRVLVDLLKCLAPGFVYSVGMPVATAVAATEALRIMLREPERVARLHANGHHFMSKAHRLGLSTGSSWGIGLIPVIIGDSLRTVLLAQRLLTRGVNAFPVLPPGVPEKTARLRFFVTAAHTPEQIDTALEVLREELDFLEHEGIGMDALPRLLKADPITAF